jgi:hypothetical protein
MPGFYYTPTPHLVSVMGISSIVHALKQKLNTANIEERRYIRDMRVAGTTLPLSEVCAASMINDAKLISFVPP